MVKDRDSRASRGLLIFGVILVGATSARGIQCYVRTHAFETAFVDCFFPLAINAFLLTLWLLFLVWNQRDLRSRDRRYGDAWRTACHVLDGEHVHNGTVLTGTWRGLPVTAHADQFYAGQYAGEIAIYVVRVPAGGPCPAWEAKLSKEPRPGQEARWKVRANARSTEERLGQAGLLVALHDVNLRPGAVRFGARLSYDPKANQVAFEDKTGSVPPPSVLEAHLELLHRAINICGSLGASAVAGATPPHPHGMPRPYLSLTEPPNWVCLLWLPTAVGLLLLDSAWPSMPVWPYGLLPAACLLPFLWPVRVRRR